MKPREELEAMRAVRCSCDHVRALTFYVGLSCSFPVLSRVLDDLRQVLGERAEVPDRPEVVMKLSRGHGLQVLLGSCLQPHGDDSHPVSPQSLGSLLHVVLGFGRSQDHQNRGKQFLISPVGRAREVGPVSLLESVSHPQGAAHEREVLLEVVQHGVLALEGVQLELTVEPVAVLGQGHAVFVGLDGETVDHLADECPHKREGLGSQVIRAVHQEHDVCILRLCKPTHKQISMNFKKGLPCLM